MSSIPLPALDVRTPTPRDPLAEFGRVASLQSSLQEQQLRSQDIQIKQQQAKDLQATTQAMNEWDPASGDYEGLSKKVLQYGGSANAATAIQQHGMQVQENVNKLKGDKLDQYVKGQHAIGDALQPGSDPNVVPDDQLHPWALNKVMELTHAGVFSPQLAQQGIQKIQTTNDPTELRTFIGQMSKSALGGAAIAAQQKEEAVTDEAAGKAREANATAAIKEIEAKGLQGITPEYINHTAQDPVTKNQALAALQRGDVMGAKEALKEGFQSALGVQKDVAVATNPAVQGAKVAVAAAEGQARANVEHQVAMGSNAALANVPTHLIAPATADDTKAGTEFAQAQAVTQRLQAMMDAAKKGNVVSYQLIPEEGALQVVTNQGIHRINMAEIQNYGGGSLWQRLQGHIGKTLTGESIPPSVLSDMADIQNIMAEGSQTKYKNTLKTINQTYGAKFEPVEMDNMPRNQPANDFFSKFGGKAR